MPTPYLTFDGTARQALAFYAEVLGGKVEFSQSFGESPTKDSVPKEFHDRLMHASLSLPDGKLMASDAGPWAPYEGKMQSCALSLHFPDAAEGKRIFDALGAGGTVTMPFEKTFWADGFGMLTDRFGVAWMVNCGPSQ
jgi:PhnB protein